MSLKKGRISILNISGLVGARGEISTPLESPNIQDYVSNLNYSNIGSLRFRRLQLAACKLAAEISPPRKTSSMQFAVDNFAVHISHKLNMLLFYMSHCRLTPMSFCSLIGPVTSKYSFQTIFADSQICITIRVHHQCMVGWNLGTLLDLSSLLWCAN